MKFKADHNSLSHTSLLTDGSLRPRQKWVFEILEPRILLSGDAFGVTLDQVDDGYSDYPGHYTDDQFIDELKDKLKLNHSPGILESPLAKAHEYSHPSPISLDDASELFEPVTPQQAQLIIVDANVPDYESLIDHISQSDSDYFVHVINADEDGVAATTQILDAYQNLSAVHILSHGNAGEFSLGDATLNINSLQAYAPVLNSWSDHLADDADVLIYGCNVASGVTGQNFIAGFAGVIGADVAASNNITGATALNGDWVLEETVGDVNTGLVFMGPELSQWKNALLTITVNDSGDDSLGSSVDSVQELIDRGDPISLRQAITAINRDFQNSVSTVHTIEFELSSNDILLGSTLPSILGAVIIDGTTDSDYVDTPIIEIDGTGNIMEISGDGVTVRGLIFNDASGSGITITGDSNTIVGNHFFGLGGYAIEAQGNNTTIGGTTAEDRNIIRDMGAYGVLVSGENGTVIKGNYIGTNIDGDAASPNAAGGIQVTGGATSITIGGSADGAGNVISGNAGSGILLSNNSSGVTIEGNLIGLDATGENALGNDSHGIRIQSDQVTPNGISVVNNTIAHNGGSGISVDGINSDGAIFSQNIIYGNTGVGIDLGGDGPTANDGNDIDAGPNNGTNFPSILSASYNGTQLTLSAVVTYSGFQSGFNMTVEYFYSETAHSTGYGDAGQYLGSSIITTSGDLFTNINDVLNVDLEQSGFITATITGVSGTSEFSSSIFVVVPIVNQSPTGDVLIAGSLIQGAMLTASNTINDGNGITGSVNYQWRRNGADISGAISDTYTLIQADVNTNIDVVATYTDDDGFDETVTSSAEGPINNLNDAPDGSVTITGTPTEDETLTANIAFTDDDGTSGSIYTYQWYRDAAAITGATNATYALGDDDVGSAIHVVVNYQDDEGTDETVTSSATTAITNVNDAPDGIVTITGTTTEDQTLTANIAFTDDDGTSGSAYTYQWYRDAVAITGATNATYVLGDGDVGSAIHVVVNYQDDEGTDETVTSSATTAITNVNDAPDGTVTITGTTTEDQTLTANIAFTDDDGTSGSTYAYQWYRDAVIVNGATSATYTLADADVGTQLHVVVSYQDDEGTSESVMSVQTTEVVNENDAPQGSVLITGNAEENSTLAASPNITDADGLPGSYSFQWYRGGIAITGATANSYTLIDTDVGNAIRVNVSYVDGEGTAEVVQSNPTALIANVNDLPIGSVVINNAAIEGDTLSASLQFTDEDGLPGTFTYQWYRNNTLITGASAENYLLNDDDVDSQIHVVVSYQDLHGTNETVTSNTTTSVSNVNDLPQGTINIAGITAEDEQLNAVLNITDDDGLPGIFNYQWYRNNVAVTGANDESYLLQDDDVGAQIHVVVTYQDAQGTNEEVASAVTPAITNVNDEPSGTVSITGMPIEDETLALNINLSDNDGISGAYSYQWYRSGAAILGATDATYTLTQADVGSTVHAVVQYTDNNGSVEAVNTEPTSVVANVNDAPQGGLSIVGIPEEDQTLTVQNTLSDEDGLPASMNYQWYRNGERVTGETGTSYTLTDADVGALIHVEVTYQDEQGTNEFAQATRTAAIANLNDTPTGTLTIVGQAIEDETLRVEVAIEDADGIATDFSYQWYRDGNLIEGATSDTYLLVAADGERNISVTASYTDAHSTQEQVSSVATAPVTVVNHAPTGSVNVVGVPRVGEVLTVDANIVDVDIIESMRFQWQRDGEAIEGATEPTYTLTPEDGGSTLSVLAIYIDAKGFEEVVLSSFANVERNVADDAVSPIETYQDQNLIAQEVEEQEQEREASDNNQNREPENNSEYSSRFEANDAAAVTKKYQDAREDEPSSVIDATTDEYNLASLVTDINHDNSNEINVAFSAEKSFSSSGFNSVIPTLNESLAIIQNSNFNSDLADAVEDMHKNAISLSAAIVGGTTAVSTGLSVGYVIWTLRSSILVTSLLSSMPAWRFIDPLPILSGNADGGDEDDESLESLVAEQEHSHDESSQASIHSSQSRV